MKHLGRRSETRAVVAVLAAQVTAAETPAEGEIRVLAIPIQGAAETLAWAIRAAVAIRVAEAPEAAAIPAVAIRVAGAPAAAELVAVELVAVAEVAVAGIPAAAAAQAAMAEEEEMVEAVAKVAAAAAVKVVTAARLPRGCRFQSCSFITIEST